jgi:hypothetical protein
MSRYPTLAAAITQLNSGDTLVIDRASTISSNETLPATVHARFEKAGLLTITDTYTLTINCSIEAGNFQIFDCSACTTSGGVAIGSGEARVSWFNDLAFAAASLSSGGGTLYIDEDDTLGAALSIASGVFPVFTNDASIDLDDYDLTLNGPIVAPSFDVFTLSGTGEVVFTGGTLLTQDGQLTNDSNEADLIFDRTDTLSAAANVARLRFYGRDNGGGTNELVRITPTCSDPTAGGEGGSLKISTANAENSGAVEKVVEISERGIEVTPNAYHARDVKYCLNAVYDVATDGGGQSSHYVGSIPDNAIVTNAWYEVLTTFTSSGSAEVRIGIGTNHNEGIKAWTAYTAFTSSGGTNGVYAGIPDGTPANFTNKTTAERRLTVAVQTADLTAGKMRIWCEYVISE